MAEEYKGLSEEQIQDRIGQTKTWVSMVLYNTGRDLDYLIKFGCKLMVYGHPYEVFMKNYRGYG